jgi:ABC-type branched-subunit amino acid transport system substrate-binding protein
MLPEPKYVALGLDRLLDYLNFREYIVIYSHKLLGTYGEVIAESKMKIVIKESDNLDSVRKQLNKNVKYSKYSTIVILGNDVEADLILSAAGEEGMSEGYHWIIGNSNGFLNYLSHSSSSIQGLCIIDSYPYDFPSAVSSLSSTLSVCLNSSQPTTFSIFSCLESSYSLNDLTQSFSPQFSVINLVNSTAVLSGNIDSTGYSHIQDIIWTSSGRVSRKIINFAHDGGLVSPSGDSLAFLRLSYNGVDLAVKYVNSRMDILPGFMLQRNVFNFGTAYFDEDFAQKELKDKKDLLQTALIAPAFSGMAINVYKLLERESSLIPIIGYSNTATKLSSTIEFPYYSRVSLPDSFITVILNLAIANWGWEQVAVIYVDNAFASGLNSDFESEADKRGLVISNRGKNKIPENLESWSSENIDPVLHEVGQGNSKILVLFCVLAEARQIILRMHDLGYSSNKFQYIAVGWLMTELINQDINSPSYNENDQNVIRESLRGSIMFFPKSFHGEFGEEMKKLYQETYKEQPGSYSGFAFDAVLALAHALSKMLLKGEDFQNPRYIMQELKDVKYLGATGYVSIDPGSNDRAPMDHSIVNTKETSSGIWEIREVGVFSPTSTTMLNYFEDILWVDGTTNIPSDKLSEFDCPFREDVVETNEKSKEIVVLYHVFILTCIILGVSLSHRDWKKISYPPITSKFLISFNDILCLSTILIDYLQTLGLLPNLEIIFSNFSIILYTVVLDYGELFNDTSKYYHIYAIGILILIFSALFRTNSSMRVIVPSIKSVLYMISDILFIPFLIFLTSIIRCTQGISDEITAAFFEYDCYTFCYKGRHLGFLIIGILSTAIYAYWVSFERCEFPEINNETQHIMISPSFSRYRNVLQGILVFMYSTIRENYQRIYIGLVCGVSFCRAILIWKLQPFNCKVFNVAYLAVEIWCLATGAGVMMMSMQVARYEYCISLIISGILISSIISAIYIIKNRYSLPFLSNSNKQKHVFRFAFRNSTAEDLSNLTSILQSPSPHSSIKVVPSNTKC